MTPTRTTDPASGAPDFLQAVEPFGLFGSWFEEAALHEPNDPNGMALATVDRDGLPNVRMVLLKGLDEPTRADRGFVFYTNLDSAKGGELAAHLRAALLFHWKSLRRQVRIRGHVTPVEPAEADAYFASRPRGSQIGAWASAQSRALDSRETLEMAVRRVEARFDGQDVPRPAHWSGFRLTPVEIEFWHDRPFRLHDRLVFRRDDPSARWVRTQLYP